MNKKELVYDKLRAQIIGCSLQPGMPINEAHFAETFGVSKTPIREAIRQLEREGLVSSIPGRGSIISYISSNDIYEIFEIREIIECGAAYRAASLADKTEFLRKREDLIKMRENLSEDDRDQNFEYCDDIHTEILRITGNKRLFRMYRDVLDTIERIRNSFGHRFTERRLENIVEEHLALLEAIIIGNKDSAQEKVREHLKNGYMYVRSLT